jgi:hypothetical protein
VKNISRVSSRPDSSNHLLKQQHFIIQAHILYPLVPATCPHTRKVAVLGTALACIQKTAANVDDGANIVKGI